MSVSNELTLLQFVALALPAVAILMQAVLNFHEMYDENDSGVTLRIEFRFLEFTFLALVVSSALFSFQILKNVEATLTRLGILIMWAGLGLIFPATWFALRRANYPSDNYESPEELVKKTAITGAKIGTPLLMMIVTLALLPRIISLEIINTSFVGITLESAFSGLIVTLVAVFVATTLKNAIDYYAQETRQKVIQEKVLLNLNEIQSVVRKKVPKSRSNKIEDRIDEIEMLQLELLEITSKNSGFFSDEVEREIARLHSKIGDMISMYQDLGDITEDIKFYKSQRNKAEEVVAETGRKRSSRDKIEVTSAEMESITNAKEYIEKVNEKIKQLKDEQEEMIQEVEQLEKDITSRSEELDQMISDK